jgi:hypothetical protein
MKHSAVFRNLFIGFISISSLICSQHAVAQSIVGKWNQVTVKQYLTDEGAKQYGKPFIVTDMSTIGTVVSEFRSNHTYTTSSSSLQGGESRSYSGSWSLDGNILTMTDQKATATVQSTVTIKSGTLVMETLRKDNKITRKVEITLKRGL